MKGTKKSLLAGEVISMRKVLAELGNPRTWGRDAAKLSAKFQAKPVGATQPSGAVGLHRRKNKMEEISRKDSLSGADFKLAAGRKSLPTKRRAVRES